MPPSRQPSVVAEADESTPSNPSVSRQASTSAQPSPKVGLHRGARRRSAGSAGTASTGAWEDALDLFEFFQLVDVIGRSYKRISQREFMRSRSSRRRVSRALLRALMLVTPGLGLLLAALMPVNPPRVRMALLAVIGLIVVEKAGLVWMHTWKGFTRRTAERVDGLLLALGCLAFTAQQIWGPGILAVNPPGDGLAYPALQIRQAGDLWVMLLVLRGFRILNLVPNYREMLVTTRSVARFLMVAALLIVLLMYCFGLLGVFLFAGELRYRKPAYEVCFVSDGLTTSMQAHQGVQRDDNATQICNALPSYIDDNIHFDSFGSALFTLFQVLTTSNWHEVMYGFMWGVQAKVAAALYFLAFYVLAVSFIFNLVIAVFIDSFENARTVLREKRRYIRDAYTGGGTDVYWKIKGLNNQSTLTAFLDSQDQAGGLQPAIDSLSQELTHSALPHMFNSQAGTVSGRVGAANASVAATRSARYQVDSTALSTSSLRHLRETITRVEAEQERKAQATRLPHPDLPASSLRTVQAYSALQGKHIQPPPMGAPLASAKHARRASPAPEQSCRRRLSTQDSSSLPPSRQPVSSLLSASGVYRSHRSVTTHTSEGSSGSVKQGPASACPESVHAADSDADDDDIYPA